MTSPITDIAIIGAGPYGLSVAAHLRKSPLTFRIFGTPMQSWQQLMPKGMLLKSDGFASSLYDPDSEFTLAHYCAEQNLPYADVGIPVPCETFIAYGLEFQKRLVPTLEQTNIGSVKRIDGGFELQTTDGQTVRARKVIVAAGITHFRYLPPFLTDLPREYVSHSAQHHDLSIFAGQRVAVIGAGASAVDIAALLNEAGAKVELVARRKQIAFHAPSQEPRPLLQRIKNPRSGLGLGWRSRLCTDAPLLFHAMPRKLRVRAVQRHLGPAPGWFVRDKVMGRFPMHLGSQIKGASVQNGKVHLDIIEQDGTPTELIFDHVIGATGFRVSIERLQFLDDSMRKAIRAVDDTPVLSTNFESSVPGLYLVGVASANSFGPLTRFAYGAKFTAKHIANHLKAAR
ncbi:NAD(P)-binding domain-containing protein [Acidicapsa ligni]|uniref:NAD(P)-binding domain-containing protein n=1 Tax=Acidicapsa ligni TaxID=542300 RepID=UPI0021DFA876|nr:NAD(P)/FAD-dependent oxidoreductase [Acidicapsa ligni]